MADWTCGYDGTSVPEGKQCPSCELYNAAVVAQQAAAADLATERNADAKDAWLNEHGVFAFVGGVATQLGSADEARPFAALTAGARDVYRSALHGAGESK
jgi:hypothetical protein